MVVESRSGRGVDLAAAVARIEDSWLRTDVIELPVRTHALAVDAEAARQALDDLARPAVSAPVAGDGAQATLTPIQIASAIGFEPGPAGELKMVVDRERITKLLRPQLAGTERPVTDARPDSPRRCCARPTSRSGCPRSTSNSSPETPPHGSARHYTATASRCGHVDGPLGSLATSAVAAAPLLDTPTDGQRDPGLSQAWQTMHCMAARETTDGRARQLPHDPIRG